MHYLLFFLFTLFFGCSKDESNTPANNDDKSVSFQFRFDKSQQRLNNIGLPSTIPAGNAAQTPDFKDMSVHYIELAPNAFTALGKGAIVYHATETTKGGESAVDFEKAVVKGENETIATIKVKDLAPGTYEWVRASVTYQKFGLKFNINAVPSIGDLKQQNGIVTSFVGFNTYLTTVKPVSKTVTVNSNKKQGFWAFETQLNAPYDLFNSISSGDAPAGATTVVNPLNATSPIPPGSCVVTGKLLTPLVVTGKETKDIVVTLSFSVNNSLEWVDANGNGQLDWYADPTKGTNERIVDMGLRGLIPSWK
jgi:hypothetical protein